MRIVAEEKDKSNIKVTVVYKGGGDEKLKAVYQLLAKIAIRDYLPDNPVKQENVKA